MNVIDLPVILIWNLQSSVNKNGIESLIVKLSVIA